MQGSPGHRDPCAIPIGFRRKGRIIAVCGYTDNVGSEAMNRTLSESRAGAVRDYLVQQGVKLTRSQRPATGIPCPVASNDDAAGRQQNRRVELVVPATPSARQQASQPAACAKRAHLKHQTGE
ncbi:MAG: OmpA family protein [Acidobacteriota bacterium]